MDCSLQKAGIWKRISAYLFDLILLGILAVLFGWVISLLTGYDNYNNRLTEAYNEYEARYGIDFDITEEDYLKLTEEQRAVYEEANRAMNADESVVYTYNMLFNLSLIIVTIGIFFAFLILEFLVPLFFGNGQTLGKKIFGVALMRSEMIRVKGPVMFIRAILGKFTIETMVPVFLILMSLFGSMGGVGIIAALLLPVINLITVCATRTHATLHDLLADTVAVDLMSQQIFENREELLEYQKRIHAEAVAKQDY